MIQTGRSFSGRERHCAFLNTRDGTFADVSAVSGLDLPDDGRGVALCDWDQDGDLDLWVSNRTGPQVRFFRNGLDAQRRSVAIRLIGTTSNRDAVGARVTLRLVDDPKPLIKSVRAGDLFLSQSSKWLVFGLGAEGRIESVAVRWPGGDDQRITGVSEPGRYEITQGAAAAVALPARTPVSIAPAPFDEPPASSTAKLYTHVSIPLPALEYANWDGARQPVAAGRPVLLLLWASWCSPCIVELREIVRHDDDISDLNIDVVALLVDGLSGESAPGGPDAARRILNRINFPFRSGVADAKLVDHLQTANDFLLDLHEPLPLPSAALLGPSGRLEALYRGPIDLPSFKKDVIALSRMQPIGLERRSFSLPFKGRWIVDAPMRESVGKLAIQLFRKGYVEDGLRYIQDNQSLLAVGNDYAEVLFAAGRSMEDRARYAEAVHWYGEALVAQRGHMNAMGRLAMLLAACPDDSVRNASQAEYLARRMVEFTSSQDFAALDILAMAFAESGRFELALIAARDAISLAEGFEQWDVVIAIRNRIELYEIQTPFRLDSQRSRN